MSLEFGALESIREVSAALLKFLGPASEKCAMTKAGERCVGGRLVTIYHVAGTDQLVFSWGG